MKYIIPLVLLFTVSAVAADAPTPYDRLSPAAQAAYNESGRQADIAIAITLDERDAALNEVARLKAEVSLLTAQVAQEQAKVVAAQQQTAEAVAKAVAETRALVKAQALAAVQGL